MEMSVTHNLLGMNANRQFGLTTKRKAKNTERLSSGYRINRAADDAAGLAISEKMRRQVRGLTQASRNAQDGISLVQIADGALHEIHDMLQRANQLAVQAANDTNSDDDRESIQQEIDALAAEVDGISDRASFNEILVLKGGSHTVTEMVTTTTTTTTKTVKLVNTELPPNMAITNQSGSDSSHLSGNHITSDSCNFTYVDSNGVTQSATATVNRNHPAAVISFNSSAISQSDLDAMDGKGFHTTCCSCSKHYSVRFSSSMNESKLETSGQHLIYTIGIQGCTTAEEVWNRVLSKTTDIPNSHFTKLQKTADGLGLIVYDGRTSDSKKGLENKILDTLPAGSSAVNITGWPGMRGYDQSYDRTVGGENGKFGPGVAEEEVKTETTTTTSPVTHEVADPRDLNLQVGSEAGQKIVITLPAIDSGKVGLGSVDVSNYQSANEAIKSIKEGLAYVSTERSRMGAYQNRLEHTIANLDNVVENTTEAESRIRDMDMAEGSMTNGMMSVLEQAGTAMLTQANQQQQRILSLLQ